MTLALLQAEAAPRRVGAEFSGLARSLRMRIQAETPGYLAMLSAVHRQLRVRRQRKPGRPPRPENCLTMARTWTDAGPFARLLPLEIDRSAGLEIHDTRLSPASINYRSWQDDGQELGFDIVCVHLVATRTGLSITTTNTVNLSLHSVARLYERIPPRLRTDAYIKASVAAIVAKTDALLALPQKTDFTIDHEHGFWVGQRLTHRIVDDPGLPGAVKLPPPRPVLTVRSFLHRRMRNDDYTEGC